MIKQKTKNLIGTIIISSFLLTLFYPHIVFHANQYLFSTKADGVKNYYNYAYHIKHDSSYFYFNGMHYPYGEYFQFVDFQPAISIPLKLVSKYIIDVSPFSIGIMNILMLFSIVVAAAFLFLIFDFYAIKGINAIAPSVAIAFLCSQPLLWQLGHYGLSYVCFIPIGWYLLLKFINNPDKRIIWWLLSFNTFFWFFMHTYLGFILTALNLIVVGTVYIFKRKKISLLKWAFSFFIQVILPVLLVFILMKVFDTKEGRVQLPFSMDHRASFFNVFLPNHAWTKPLYGLFFNMEKQKEIQWGMMGNYIGITSNLTLLFLFFFILRSVYRKTNTTLNKIFTIETSIFLIASFLILLYSMAIPLRFAPDFFLKFIPQITQLVGIGRFAWVFYFVVTVFSFIVLNQFLSSKKTLVLTIVISVFILSEALGYHLFLGDLTSKNYNLFNKESEKQCMSDLQHIDFNKYQAILCIPFHHGYITAHNFKPTDKSINLSMQLSYFSGLPQFFALLSRPSQSEARNILQIFAPAYYTKPIQKDLSTDKPILITYSKDEISTYEKNMLNKSKIIFKNDEFILSELALDSVFKFDRTSIFNDFENAKNKGFLVGKDIYLTDTTNYFYFNRFENYRTNRVFEGKGSFQFEKQEYTKLFQSEPGDFTSGEQYEISFWYYNHLYDQSFNTMRLVEKNENGKVVSTKYFDPIRPCTYKNDWVFNKIAFEVKNDSNTISLVSKGARQYSDSLWIDNLMVKSIECDVFIPEYVLDSLVSIQYNNETFSDE